MRKERYVSICVCPFQRRLEELSERLSGSENKALLLLSELEERGEALKESQRILAEVDDQRATNDLDDFAMKEGGLIGVAREVDAVMDLLQVRVLSALLRVVCSPTRAFTRPALIFHDFSLDSF